MHELLKGVGRIADDAELFGGAIEIARLPLPTDREAPASCRLSDPCGYLEARRGRLTIIDEVQRVPGLFQVLRGLIDERIRHGEAAGVRRLAEELASLAADGGEMPGRYG
jgi:hypothetical protein